MPATAKHYVAVSRLLYGPDAISHKMCGMHMVIDGDGVVHRLDDQARPICHLVCKRFFELSCIHLLNQPCVDTRTID